MPPLLSQRLRRFIAKLGFERDWYLVLVAALIGVVMSGVAIAFIMPLRALENLGDRIDAGPLLYLLVPLVPVVGALLAGLLIHLMPTEMRGPGVSTVMYAVYRKKSRLPARLGVRKWLASTLTIGSGGSAGAEGPIVTIGSVLGSWVARRLRTNPQHTATMLGCGAAAGLASVFNAPIAGIFFVLEILLRDFSLRTFTPIVIASVISSACTRSVLGSNDALFALADDFSINTFNALEIPHYLILGLLCGAVAVMFIRGLYLSADGFARLKIHPALKPAAGALVLGLIGLAYLVVYKSVPGFYGNGYPMIKEVIRPGYFYLDDANEVLKPALTLLTGLVALAFLKGVATSLTIGSGGAGGMFAPSMLIGASVGGTFGYLVNALGWFPSATPAHYAVVGMAAMVAATTHAPLTAILIVYEITQSYEIILPLMFTAVISTVVGRLLYRESIYTVRLTHLGVRIGAMSDLTILRRLSVSDVQLVPPVTVNTDESAQRLLDLSEQFAVSDFVVMDDRKHYVGLVTSADLKEALIFREAIPLLQVNELQRSDLPTVTPDETLDLVLDKFSRHDVQSLAVLDESGDGSVLGLITRSRLMHRYQSALSKD